MAEIAVSFAVEKMGDLLFQEAMFCGGVPVQVDLLKDELRRMQSFLKDADARQHEAERVRNWVSEIRDLAYQAEDAIDLYLSSVAVPGKTKLFPWRIFKKQVSRWKTGKRIEGIQKKLEGISTSLVAYGINNSFGEATTPAGQMLQKLRYISPLVEENIVVGLQKQTDELVEQLVGRDERRRVVSIVGMGGLGKTTLAKQAYNDPRVLNHFPSYRAWAYVSEDCRPRDVFLQILNRLPDIPTKPAKRNTEKFPENQLGDLLHEHLKGERFLVVLDDIWKSEDWKCVARAFPEDNSGSRLLLTTRNTEVALQADARSTPHQMQVLSDEESWKLFCRTAIPEEHDGDTETCPPGLEEMGERMVKKCGGLPLAIVVLGGLLSRKPRSSTVWENVLNNLQAHFAGANGVDAVLSLSYVDLPHHLKSCFLYMGMYPEDQVIPKERLLQLWIAEGFVAQQEEEDGQRWEDRAEEYLNELVNRNLVQVAKVSMNERVTQCRIHDVVRELCIKKAKELNFFKIVSTSSPRSSRRLGIYQEDMDNWYASREPSTPYVRSLLFFNMKQPTFTFSHRHFKLLRVLDLSIFPTTTIRFGELIHLRYLRLQVKFDHCWDTRRRSNHLYLPTSLQTLIWENFSFFLEIEGTYLASLGRAVQNLENLRHLSLCIYGDRSEPLRIEGLRNLQTLSGIRSSDWVQNDTRELNSLRKLEIYLDNCVEDEAGQLSNSIAKCKNLRSLCLNTWSQVGLEIPCIVMNSWLRLTKLHMKGPIPKLPEAHEFPPSLTQLTLERTELDSGSMLILQKLPKLLTLRLKRKAFSGCVRVAKGGMPKLTRLQIYASSYYIEGLDELLNLKKVDIDYETMTSNDYKMPDDLPSRSQWLEIRSKNEGGEIIRNFLRK